MVEVVHVSDNQINSFAAMSSVVNYLPELRRERQYIIWFIAVEIPKEDKLGMWKFCFHKIEIHGDMIREESLFP